VRALRHPALLLVLLLPALDARPAAGDEAVAPRLARARFLEYMENRCGDALVEYEAVLGLPALAVDDRGEALLGAARCHRKLDREARAQEIWESILADAAMPIPVKEQARREMAIGRPSTETPDMEHLLEVARAQDLQQKREQAALLVEQARAALGEGNVAAAQRHAFEAVGLDPENVEAQALLGDVLSGRPDQGRLVVELFRFLDTARREARERLLAGVARLEREGQDAYKSGEYQNADALFREAIRLVDEGEFVSDLLEERAAVLTWLRGTIRRAREVGIVLPDEPPYPRLTAATGLHAQFMELVRRMFQTGPQEGDPYRVFDVRPAPGGSGHTSFVAGAFADDIAGGQSAGRLDRAGWAERWMRANVGTGWQPPRILSRFDHVLVVHHTATEIRRVEQLLSGFSPLPPPLKVDVAIFATTTPGAVRLQSALAARTPPVKHALCLVFPDLLWSESVGEAGALEGVRLLGTAELSLAGGDVSSRLLFTRPAEAHPAFQGLGNPPLQVTDEDARYGLLLDVYAEDMPGFKDARRAAVSLEATTTHPLSSVVLPRERTDDWQRLPKPMAAQTVGADQVLPHAGTLLLVGLANPFPESREAHPDLVVLLGVRAIEPGGTAPGADPPRAPVSPLPTAPGDTEERVYALSPLATEVRDEIVLEGWPQRPAAAPLPLQVVRAARENYLAERLGIDWGGLVQPGQPTPVRVEGERATARLKPESHQRLAGAVEWFRANEGTLFEVDVVAAEVEDGTLAAWLTVGAAQGFTPGTYHVTNPTAHAQLDQLMREAAGEGGMFAIQASLLARATQTILARNLHTYTIVENLHHYRMEDGRQRYVPVPGVTEEGIIVIARPELERDGRRRLIADARIARLRSIELVPLPGVEEDQARVQVPRHFPVGVRRAALDLADDHALLLTLPEPTGSGRVIVVKLQARRIR
jgi:tetratricopeptide (TPR) repeat protein